MRIKIHAVLFVNQMPVPGCGLNGNGDVRDRIVVGSEKFKGGELEMDEAGNVWARLPSCEAPDANPVFYPAHTVKRVTGFVWPTSSLPQRKP